MCLRVIGKQMASFGDRPRNLRTGSHEASNQEKRCLCIMACKDFEQAFGMNVIWTVVVGKCQVPRIWKMSYGAAVKLRFRRIAVIGEISCAGEDAGDS